MRAQPFFRLAITWLRTAQNVQTTVQPDDRIDTDPTGAARIDGHQAHPSTAARWGFAGLYTLCLGAVLMMVEPASASQDLRGGIHKVGYASAMLAIGCFARAERLRRRHRTAVVIELREGDLTTDEAMFCALSSSKGNAQAWLITERVPEREALARARAHGVRVFAREGDTFIEASAVPTPDAVDGAIRPPRETSSSQRDLSRSLP